MPVKKYTNSQMIIHNFPLLLMYVLGSILVAYLNLFFAIIFIVYIIISNILFMVHICVFCPHYGTRTSQCGYGLATKYFAKRKSLKEFNKNFKKYIAVLFPDWFVPTIIGFYLLIITFDWIVVIILIIFMVIGFGVIPFGSRSKCKSCKHRKQCPWMDISGNKKTNRT